MSTGPWKRHSAEEAAMEPVAVMIGQRSWDEVEHHTLSRMRRTLDRARRLGGNFEFIQLMSELDDDLRVLEQGDPKENARNEQVLAYLRGQMPLPMGTTPQVSA